MHLLAAQAGAIQQEGEAIDLGQTPGQIVFASSADSELALLAGAADRTGYDDLRLANLLRLGHNLSVDLWLDQTVRHARLVVVRLLGGPAYWPYGTDELIALAAAGVVQLALLPGDATPDAILRQRSTIDEAAWDRLFDRLVAGGPENADAALALLRGLAGDVGVPAIRPMATFSRFGIWPTPTRPLRGHPPHKGEGENVAQPSHGPPSPLWGGKRQQGGGWQPGADEFASSLPLVPILFYRALLEGAGTAVIESLTTALAARGLAPLPIFVSSLKEAEAVAFVQQTFAAQPPDVILNLTGFALGLDGLPAAQNPFAGTDAPVIQLIQSGRPEALWAADSQGLSAKDLAMQVVMPELDGRIGMLLVGHKAGSLWHARTQCPLTSYAPDNEGIARAADLAANWVRLRRTPRAERRIAVVLANYPIRDGRLANGVGYDAPQSTVEILNALRGAGYALSDLPADGNVLVEGLQAGPTNAHPERPGGIPLPLDRYHALFATLPPAISVAVTARWGEPAADPFVRDGAFHLPGLRFGNVALLLQPSRGYHLDETASYHDPDLVPPHGYLAAYLWLRHEFAAHAKIYNGKHGNLEWLPGKAVALDGENYPLALWGTLPHLYPFIVNDPGEGTQAKRRTGAVIIDHLVPPLTRAETYGPLKDLEALLDEYYAASGLDRRRLADLRRRILAFARDARLDQDVALPDDQAEALKTLDNFLCDLKEAQIRDGLHIFGRSPEGRLERDLIVALARVPRGESPGEASLIRALADDLGLGFDPLTAKLGDAWAGPIPARFRLGVSTPTPSPSPQGGGGQGGFAAHGQRNIEGARRLRNGATMPERSLWPLLRSFKEQGVHFRRQVPFGPYVADFASHHPKLIVELDGDTHFNDAAELKDAARTAFLRSAGYHVLRFTNRDVATNPDGIWQIVSDALAALAAPPPSPLRGGAGGGGHALRTVGDVLEQLEALAAELVEGTAAPHPDWRATAAVRATIDTTIRPRLRASGPGEIQALLDGLDGKFIPPGPSGAPSRGRLDVLPTGRNFYSVDNRAVPTSTAWELGKKSAENVLLRHLQDHGAYLKAIALSAWGTANMRTGGDDIAQALAFIGAKPVWDPGSLRVSGYEIIPLARLGRPRVDVTLKISGFFRDAFPAQIALFDRAVRAIGALDEPEDENPIAARMRTEALGLMAAGASETDAARQAGYRIFGSKPGAYGAGLQGLIDSGSWQGKGDLAEAFLEWGQYAYGARDAGTPDRARFAARLGMVEAVVHNQDNREHDLLDSDDYYQFEGGLSATVETLAGQRPAAYHNDHSRPERPQARTLEEEVARVVRSRVVNPKWIAGVKRHGYKGAFEIIATVDYMFAFAATTGAVKSHHFDLAFAAFVEDAETRDFLVANNRFGYDELIQKFNEARTRGFWMPRSNAAFALLEGTNHD
jgi:cobaltochelatase CobN